MTRKRLTGPCTGAVKDWVSCAIETSPSLSTPSAIGLLRRPPVKALLNPANISECRANFQPLFQLERRLLAIQARPGRGAPDIAAKLTAESSEERGVGEKVRGTCISRGAPVY